MSARPGELFPILAPIAQIHPDISASEHSVIEGRVCTHRRRGTIVIFFSQMRYANMAIAHCARARSANGGPLTTSEVTGMERHRVCN